MIIKGNECGDNTKGFWVYEGRCKSTNHLVYIGTTTQKPSDRFKSHRHTGKDLAFSVIKSLSNSDDMMSLESELIAKHSPRLNKRAKQNFNKKLSEDQISVRVGDVCWCQSCLKRRVSKGYTKCMWCS